MTVLSVAARRGLGLAAGVVLAGALLAAPVAAAKPTKCHIVDVGTHRDFSTLQAAVDAAAPGATLRVKGTCVGTTTIIKDLAVTGESKPGVGTATLDGNGAGTVLTIAGGVVSVTGLTITGGNATFGGGVAALLLDLGGPDVTVTRSMITHNTATDGGGIWKKEGTIRLIDTIVSDNSASRNGGGYMSTFLDLYASGATRFTGNHAGLDGGGIYQNSHGKTTLSDTVSVDHNTAGQDGGGIVITDGNVFLNDSASIHHNTAGRDGGGVWSVGAPGVLYLNDGASIRKNTAAGSGGGAFLGDSSAFRMAGTSSISRNTAAASGGGVWVRYWCSLVALETSTITHNAAGAVGGGVFVDSTSPGGVTLDGGRLGGTPRTTVTRPSPSPAAPNSARFARSQPPAAGTRPPRTHRRPALCDRFATTTRPDGYWAHCSCAAVRQSDLWCSAPIGRDRLPPALPETTRRGDVSVAAPRSLVA